MLQFLLFSSTPPFVRRHIGAPHSKTCSPALPHPEFTSLVLNLMVCRTKSILANHSCVSRVGRALGHDSLMSAQKSSTCIGYIINYTTNQSGAVPLISCSLSSYLQRQFCPHPLTPPPWNKSPPEQAPDKFSLLKCESVRLCRAKRVPLFEQRTPENWLVFLITQSAWICLQPPLSFYSRLSVNRLELPVSFPLRTNGLMLAAAAAALTTTKHFIPRHW